MRKKVIPEYGPITHLLERVFRGMQYASLAIILFGTASGHRGYFKGPSDSREFDIWRARHLDYYLSLWLLFEIATALLIALACVPAHCLILSMLFLIAYRMLDILQASVNINVFAQLRDIPGNNILNATRALVLSIWTFVELALCFGVIYSSPISHLSGSAGWWDAYYFSIITQLTIGYGDIHPEGVTKLFASLQGLFGFILALVVIGRLVSILPRPTAVVGPNE
jgi:Ion channel